MIQAIHLRSCEQSLPEPRPEFLDELRRMEELAALDRSGRFAVVADPAAADLILFVESTSYESNCGPYLEGVRRDPVYRAHRSKSLVYSAFDFPVPFVPGIYPSIDRRWYWRSLARPGCYISGTNAYIREFAGAEPVEPRLLASFVGCLSNQPVRRRLATIRGESIHVADTTDEFLAAVHAGRHDELRRLKRDFVAIMSRSRFVLCPRGLGASSIRLFEAMQMGRAPVILSDEWVPPEGPAWDTFAVRVRERDVLDVPAILRARAGDAAELGRVARLAWEEWFSPEQLFRRLGETAADLLAARRRRFRAGRHLANLHLARPMHARALFHRLRRRLR